MARSRRRRSRGFRLFGLGIVPLLLIGGTAYYFRSKIAGIFGGLFQKKSTTPVPAPTTPAK